MIHLICPNPGLDRTILLDTFHFGSPNRPIELREYPGGKSFNVAYALSYTQDVPVNIHTILGGEVGELVKKLASCKKIKVISTKVIENTRTCNIVVDTTNHTTLPIYEHGFTLTEEILKEFTNKLIYSIQDNDCVVFSGSLMKGMPANYILQIKEKIEKSKNNVKMYVDTSGDSLKEAYKAAPYMIKVNDEEVQELFPEVTLKVQEDYLHLLKHTITPTIPYFIITLGKDGVIARMKDQYFYISCKPIRTKNPIASGDFFLGRLINELLSKRSYSTALTKATAFSTANCLSWFPEVDRDTLKKIEQDTTCIELN